MLGHVGVWHTRPSVLYIAYNTLQCPPPPAPPPPPPPLPLPSPPVSVFGPSSFSASDTPTHKIVSFRREDPSFPTLRRPTNPLLLTGPTVYLPSFPFLLQFWIAFCVFSVNDVSSVNTTRVLWTRFSALKIIIIIIIIIITIIIMYRAYNARAYNNCFVDKIYRHANYYYYCCYYHYYSI